MAKRKNVFGSFMDWLVFTKPLAWIARIGLGIRGRQVRKNCRDMGIYLDRNGWLANDPTDDAEATRQPCQRSSQ